ncbi:hypothetical protein ABQX22_00475 [Xanthomonas sp. WHRI 1810A]|uniref:OB-fold protein n=1 Tax=Xanthomonas sp. WHRI 1810A TaxID=3161565 RepID=UPI0032E9193A
MSEAIAVATPQKRYVGFLLGLGILFFPLLFGWMLLRKGHSLLARIIGLTWMVLSFLSLLGIASVSKTSYDRYVESAANSALSSSKATPREQAHATPIKAYTASQVATSYDDNTVAADIQFKDKRVKVSGRITDINTDMFGKPYLVLAGTNQFMGPQFKFDKSDMSVMATMKKGTTVSVICTGKGDVAKIPMFEDCEMSQ